ncbi:MAG: alpha/beta hydrolase [Acidobacteriaceae bacterium]|nr:alpha/beta hydrolase [Acidobacteriaceae bacterium]
MIAIRSAFGLWVGRLAAITALGFAIVSASAQARSAVVRADDDTQLTSLVLKTKAGLTLNYVVQGDAKGPVIVMLHGAGDSWHSYDRVFPLLPRRFRVYAITLRGHGLSDHPATGYSSADFAGDVLDFMEQMKISHATLVGHSLGSFVSQKVAELDGASGSPRIDRVVLIGSGPGLVKSSDGASALMNVFSGLKDPVPYTFARDFQASTIYHPVPAAFFETMVGEAQRVSADTWHGLGGGHREPVEELKKIQVPVLVLWGEQDSIFKRADEDLLVKTLPHAKFSVYPETGHALHWERPERFTREMLAFIAANGGSK